LIPIPRDDIALLVQEYVPEAVFRFCSPEVQHAAIAALSEIGNPKVTVENAWMVFTAILPIVMRMVLAGNS
jgi:hypothetical protein